MTSDSAKRAMKKYYQAQKKNKRVFVLRFDRRTDADIIKALEGFGGTYTDAARHLIRKGL